MLLSYYCLMLLCYGIFLNCLHNQLFSCFGSYSIFTKMQIDFKLILIVLNLHEERVFEGITGYFCCK
jgi:uncharacterized membrane protein